MKNLKIYIGIKGAGRSIELDKDLLPVPPRLAQVPLIDLFNIKVDDLARELRAIVAEMGILNSAQATSDGQEQG